MSCTSFLHFLQRLKEADFVLLVFLIVGTPDEIQLRGQEDGDLGNGKIIKKNTVYEV